jgi:predicted Zn-dependent protease
MNWRHGFAVAICIGANLCAGIAPGIGARGVLAAPAITEDREIELGESYAAALLSQAKLLENDPVQEYVNQVGRWLTANTERADLPWQFGVMNMNEIGAYPMPGGKVIITKGLLRKLTSEGELAGVLAHEIAHVVRRHQIAGETSPERIGAINYPLSPELELEADRMAIVIMSRAGYSAESYVAAMRTLQNSGGDAGLAMMTAIHPPWRDRISQVEPHIGKLPKADKNKGRDRFNAAISALSRGGRK